MSILQSIGAFIIALGLLVVVHEFGHYWIARRCGVKVLRFSVGFGRTLWMRRMGTDQTEWAVAAIPLGGFVKMLDEREGPVAEAERHRAFNNQSVGKRIAIVLAGPLANLILAVLVYWLLFISGEQQMRPILGEPEPQSAVAAAGFRSGEELYAIDGEPVRAWSEARWKIAQVAFDHRPISVEVREAGQSRTHFIDPSGIKFDEKAGDILHQLGFKAFEPSVPPVVGYIEQGSAAERAGLRVGDTIRSIDGQALVDWQAVVKAIQAAPEKSLSVGLVRGSQTLQLPLVPKAKQDGTRTIGLAGIRPYIDPKFDEQYLVTLRYGPLEAIGLAFGRTWDTAMFSLKMFGRMITGDISWRNLSGPLTIADYAGQSAKMGLEPFAKFIALISISLGVLNLMPIPLLDGGHFLYYLVEIVRGRPVSERVMEIGQQVGLAILAILMAFALYNDINRLISG